MTYLPTIDFTARLRPQTEEKEKKKGTNYFSPVRSSFPAGCCFFLKSYSVCEVSSRHEKCTFPESHTADFNYSKYFFSGSSCEKISASSTEKTQWFYLLLSIHHKCANIVGLLKGGLFNLSKGLINRFLFTEGCTACREYEFLLLFILI